MSEPTEATEPPDVDLEKWNVGLCKEELDLYPNQVAVLVAVIVAERTGQVATLEWIQKLTGINPTMMAPLSRRNWCKADERVGNAPKVWKPRTRAWQALGFDELRPRQAS